MAWNDPIKRVRAASGKMVTIDVTLSVNPALSFNKAIADVIAFFKAVGVVDVLDFGAGSLRHSLPLLAAGFQVCAVEFKKQYANPKSVCSKNLALASLSPDFRLLLPEDLIEDEQRFDAALFCYTPQGMPIMEDRRRVLRILYRKLRARPRSAPRSEQAEEERPNPRGYLVWMSRWGDERFLPASQKVKDGFYKSARSKTHSFYREYKNAVIRSLLERVFRGKGFHHLRSLGKGGRDQIFVFSKHPDAAWPEALSPP